MSQADVSEPGFRLCAIIPSYDNPRTVEAVARQVSARIPAVFVVDDGSGDAGRVACEATGAVAQVVRRHQNGGKGAAVKTGLRAALEAGFTHAVQVDADGQHDLESLDALIDAARTRPDALVLGYPVYDETAPTVRKVARRFTDFWVRLEVGGPHIIEDAMVGFRVYPIAATLAAGARGDRMDFDIEVAVRMVWAGVATANVPVKVRYLTAEEGGVSHFQPLMDNLRFSWLHTRLTTARFLGWVFGRARRRRLGPR